ncbi:SgcJ/EcaC family oxidoreductase [Parapedomonas caeni]
MTVRTMACLGLVIAALAGNGLPVQAREQGKTEMSATDAKIAVVQQMIEAWNTRDWVRVGELFTEDGVLHSMMIEPVVGRAAIAQRISALGAGVSEITLDIRNIGRVGDVVFVERVDRFTYNGHKGAVPVVGVIEVRGDRISVWREYYDRAQLLAEMGVSQDIHASH